LEEELIGWVASQSIGRLPYGASKGGYGYGLYFTNKRLIGISYKNIVSRAYRPGYLLELIGFVLLGFIAAYFAFTRPQGDQPIPLAILVILLIMLVSMAMSAVFLRFSLSRRQAAHGIQREASPSILDLTNLQSDVSLERAEISQVIVEGYRISILMKTGEWFLFGVQYPRALAAREDVLSLFQKFCALPPIINLFVKKRKKHWYLGSKAETLA
jgi:hypothetical protein